MDKKSHVINKKTGYCYTCNKYENDELKEKKYTEYFTLSSQPTSSPNSLSKIKHAFEEDEESPSAIKYKLYENFDCTQGKLGEKLRACRLCETLYYVPVWALSLLILTFASLVAVTIYLGVTYNSKLQLKSYNEDCSSASCDTSKGLYCRTTNSSSNENCWCPADVQQNNCDCLSSYYWNGLECSPVYGYNEGPCSGDYSCHDGLTCNTINSLCTCPSIKPKWDSSMKTCDYSHLGCFNECSSPCDYTSSDIVLQSGVPSATTFVEIDDCLNLCNLFGYKYGLIFSRSTSYGCICSNSYNTYATQIADSICNQPCSYNNPTGQNKCTRTASTFSAFQIGS